jgi:hypothetical protein
VPFYQDIFPVWDWQKIPGTTVEQNGVFAGSPRRKGTKDFVGGVSDGQYGLAVFDLERDKLQARKAWFFFDREYVCLGAGITCRSQNQVITTANQCYLRGDVTTFSSAEEKRLSKGEHRLESPITVHHNNVTYIFDSDANVLLRNTLQEGAGTQSADLVRRTRFPVTSLPSALTTGRFRRMPLILISFGCNRPSAPRESLLCQQVTWFARCLEYAKSLKHYTPGFAAFSGVSIALAGKPVSHCVQGHRTLHRMYGQ